MATCDFSRLSSRFSEYVFQLLRCADKTSCVYGMLRLQQLLRIVISQLTLEIQSGLHVPPSKRGVQRGAARAYTAQVRRGPRLQMGRRFHSPPPVTDLSRNFGRRRQHARLSWRRTVTTGPWWTGWTRGRKRWGIGLVRRLEYEASSYMHTSASLSPPRSRPARPPPRASPCSLPRRWPQARSPIPHCPVQARVLLHKCLSAFTCLRIS